jgi:hypothetical protein
MWRAKTGWLFVLALAAFWDANQLAVEQDPYERVMRRAIALLPKQPGLVVVFDVDTASPELKRTLLHLDSFVIKGRREIYLTSPEAR